MAYMLTQGFLLVWHLHQQSSKEWWKHFSKIYLWHVCILMTFWLLVKLLKSTSHQFNYSLNRLQEAGLRLQREKCCFICVRVFGTHHLCSRVETISQEDQGNYWYSTTHKVVRNQMVPGITYSYYVNFLPNIAATFAPLYKLLQEGRSGSGTQSKRVVSTKPNSSN